MSTRALRVVHATECAASGTLPGREPGAHTPIDAASTYGASARRWVFPISWKGRCAGPAIRSVSPFS